MKRPQWKSAFGAQNVFPKGNGRRRIGPYVSLSAFDEVVETILADWVDATEEMLTRWGLDRSALQRSIGWKNAPGTILRLRLGLSDPHDGGKTAAMLLFGSGKRVIYKPRPSHGEKLWFRLLGRLNGAGFGPLFRIPAHLGRDRYSWMEFISRRPCRSIGGVERFYFAWGIQAALAEFAGFTDLHHENWVANGAWPVLVDAEAFGREAWKLRRLGEPPERVNSLLETGLLPSHEARSCRGIAPFDRAEFFANSPRAWPRLRGAVQPPERFVPLITAGYDAAARFLASHPALRGHVRAAVRRAADKSRVFVRRSAEYHARLMQSLDPYYLLTNESQRARFFYERCMQAAPSDAIARAEVRALLRCSVPRFTAGDDRRFPKGSAIPPPASPSGGELTSGSLFSFFLESSELTR